MSLCINPKCQNPDNPDHLLYCQSCQSELLLEGRYRVISLLGEGGFAKTYEVSDRTTIPKVIKVLSKNEPKPVEQFQREAGSYDKTIIVLPDQILESHSDVVFSVAISPDGQTVISGSRDTEIKVWNLKTGELLYTLTGHEGSVLSIAISPDGKTLFSASEDKTVKVWDLTTQQEINTLTKYLDAVTSLVISPDGKTLISGSHDGTIKIWSVQ